MPLLDDRWTAPGRRFAGLLRSRSGSGSPARPHHPPEAAGRGVGKQIGDPPATRYTHLAWRHAPQKSAAPRRASVFPASWRSRSQLALLPLGQKRLFPLRACGFNRLLSLLHFVAVTMYVALLRWRCRPSAASPLAKDAYARLSSKVKVPSRRKRTRQPSGARCTRLSAQSSLMRSIAASNSPEPNCCGIHDDPASALRARECPPRPSRPAHPVSWCAGGRLNRPMPCGHRPLVRPRGEDRRRASDSVESLLGCQHRGGMSPGPGTDRVVNFVHRSIVGERRRVSA